MFFKKSATPTNNNLATTKPAYNILFIGGSNTVMKLGYVSQLIDLLQSNVIVEVGKIDNIAVGASSCTLALENISKMSNLSEYDIFFIEYTINDISLFSKEGGELTWRYAYEGLIRLILKQKPNAIIAPLIFGRLHEKSVAAQEEMRQFIQALQPIYNLCVVDNDAMLRSVKSSAAQFKSLYLDGEHYSYPYATSLIAHQIYYCLLQYLAQNPAYNLSPLPPAQEKYCFDNIATFDLSSDYKNKQKYAINNFTNSRYNLNAIAIPVGGSITLELPSPLISLSFVSATTSCSLLIDSDGEATVIDTLHRKVRDGDFNFLYKNFTFTDSRWRNDFFRTPRTITLKAIDNNERSTLKKHYKDAFNMISNHHPETNELRVYLCNLIYVK